MKLDYSFQRTEAQIGTDAVPNNAAYLNNSNVFHAPQYGINSEPIESIAIAYSGPVGSPEMVSNFYIYDEYTTTWYLLAGNEIIEPGHIKYVSLPNIIDRKDTRINSRISVAIVVSTPDPTPPGAYIFTLASATAGASGGGGGGGEIEGMDADHDPAIANPVGVGGVYLADPGAAPLDEGDIGRVLVNALRMIVTQNMGIVEDADPAAIVPGLVRHFRLDEFGRLIVTGGGQVEGMDADHDPATANPVAVGGEYRADWYADFLNDGDAGRALINSQRMFVVENRVYDAPTDADRVVPVVQTFDNHEPFDQSVTVATAAVITYYFDARTFPYWSMQLHTPGIETINILISASNEATEPDLTLRDYVDITSDLYGSTPIVLTSASDIALSVDTPLIWDSYRIQYTPSGLATWTALGKKGSF